MNKQKKVKVLFVCMGNICRSPTAHGVFQHLINTHGFSGKIEIDSAGTHSYHVGSQPDMRAQGAAETKGIDLSYIKSRQVCDKDYEYYDYIIAMDKDNYRILDKHCPEQYRKKISLLLDYAPEHPLREVPDPYYGGVKGFENVFDMVEIASNGLLDKIKKQLS